MLTGLIILIVVTIVFFGITVVHDGKNPYYINLHIATFGGSSYVSEIELRDNRFVALTHNDRINEHSPYELKTIGEMEYYISVRFQVWAAKELGRKYSFKNKGRKDFRCPVTKDGIPITRSEFYRMVNSKMLSKKNPTERVWYEELGPPNNTSIKHVECIKF